MTPAFYRAERRRLVQAIAWHRWSAQRGYHPAAADLCEAQRRELAQLRAQRTAA